MKQWTKEIEINAPIEKVWNLLNGSLEQMQKIMPQVIGNSPVKLTEEFVGSIYRQQYKEGKRIEEYDVETLDYLNDHDQIKWFLKFFMMFATEKVVVEFVERVKRVAETEK